MLARGEFQSRSAELGERLHARLRGLVGHGVLGAWPGSWREAPAAHAALQPIVNKLMAKNPDHSYASADALLAVANAHLDELAPRYQLERVPKHDLELQVIDRDLGDEVRSVQSLSGGESFLVSLALALGLSSMSALVSMLVVWLVVELAKADGESQDPQATFIVNSWLNVLAIGMAALALTTAAAMRTFERGFMDKLLAMPQYGERWGRHWLDAARYADSDGYEKDMSREMWPYRDYVINAFNKDLPYDQFIVEQISGDLLPKATQQQVIATGFATKLPYTPENPQSCSQVNFNHQAVTPLKATYRGTPAALVKLASPPSD